MRARGGFEVAELTWVDGNITSLKVKSTIGGNLRLRVPSELKMSDGTALTAASGDNSNPLTQPYGMPAPVVKNQSKIPTTVLPTTFVYDIPTTAGEEITLVPIADGIEQLKADTTAGNGSVDSAADGATYNLAGQRVGDDYHGIAIMGSQKKVK